MTRFAITRTDGHPGRHEFDFPLLHLGGELLVQGDRLSLEPLWDALGPGYALARFDLEVDDTTYRGCRVVRRNNMVRPKEGNAEQCVIRYVIDETKLERQWRQMGRLFAACGVASLVVDLAVVYPQSKAHTLFQTIAIASVFLVAVPCGQFLIGRALNFSAILFAPDVPGGAKNRWPQRFIGTLEAVLFPVALTWFREDALEILGAWIGLKTFGDWSRFKGGPGDEDAGRRRLYRFLIGNALQVAMGMAVAAVLKSIRG